MTSPVYGQGFIDLEPRLDQGFLNAINRQLQRAFSDVRLDVDQRSFSQVSDHLDRIRSAATTSAAEVGEMARKADAANVDFRQLAQHLDISEDEARALATRLQIATTEARQLEDEATKVARQLGLSEKEARDFAASMARASDVKSLNQLNTTLGTVRASLSRAALAAVAFFGIRGVLGAASAARDSFTALSESVNAVQVIFGDASETIFDFSENVARSAGLAKSEFQQMSTVLGAALSNAGFSADETAAKTIQLTQRAADMASVFNTDVAEALGAIQAALRGEADPIERFGVGLAAAAVSARASALGFKAVAGEFTATEKAAARLSLIMEQTDKVAGDFVNTADSLANRQRVAAAEAENLRAELGEALLPVYEALVDLGPELLEGVKDLTPALAALAESVAGMAESTPGVIDLADALHLLTDLPRGFGQIFDGIETQIGVVSGSAQALAGLLSFGLVGGFEEGIDRVKGAVNDLQENALERVNTQGLIDDLRQGGDAANSLAIRLEQVGRKGKLDPKFIRALTQIAGVDLATNVTVLEELVAQADQLGFEADDVAALGVVLSGLRGQLEPGIEALRVQRDALAALGDAAPEVATALDLVGIRAAEADLSMADLLAGVNPLAAGLLATLTPAEELALRMDALAAGTATAAEAFLSNLQPSLIDVQEGLKDLNEDGQVSLEEFTTSLGTAAQEFLDFMVDIAAIAAISPELARALKDLGPDAAGLLADGFAKADEGAILAAAENLIGSPEQIGAAMQGIYAAGLESVDGSDPAAVQAWLGFIADTFEEDLPGITAIMAGVFQPSLDAAIEGLDPPDLNPSLQAGIAAIRVQEGTDAFQKVFNLLVEGLNIDLTQPGRDSMDAFFVGMQESLAGRADELKSAITGTLDRAIERQSPPKLFERAGEDSGHAFWDSFAQVPLSFPDVGVAGAPLTSTRAETILPDGESGGGDTNLEVNFYDTRERPAEESLQEAGVQVATMLNLRRR